MADASTLFVSGFVPTSRVNGPGRRAVLWVQGCTLNCPGCFNPSTHSTGAAGTPIEQVLAQILDARAAGATGVTFSGGEPFEQADALGALAEALRAAWPEASRMAYTGYTRAALLGADAPAGAARLLGALDLLVDGAFDPSRVLKNSPVASRPLFAEPRRSEFLNDSPESFPDSGLAISENRLTSARSEVSQQPARRAQTRPWRASTNQQLWVLGRPPKVWTDPAEAELHVTSEGSVLLSGLPDARLRRAVAHLS